MATSNPSGTTSAEPALSTFQALGISRAGATSLLLYRNVVADSADRVRLARIFYSVLKGDTAGLDSTQSRRLDCEGYTYLTSELLGDGVKAGGAQQFALAMPVLDAADRRRLSELGFRIAEQARQHW